MCNLADNNGVYDNEVREFKMISDFLRANNTARQFENLNFTNKMLRWRFTIAEVMRTTWMTMQGIQD